jgi:hypothetical protein
MSKGFPILASVLPLAGAVPAGLAQTSQNAQHKELLGTLENGVYHHTLTGIEFTLAADWVIVSEAPASQQDAEVVNLKNSSSTGMATVWLKRRNADRADIPALMSGRLDAKVVQRNNFQGYKFRPESVQHTTIGGRPALSAIADYVGAGQKMVEYVTWVDGERSRVVFVGRMPVSDLADFQTRFEPVIRSVIVP